MNSNCLYLYVMLTGDSVSDPGTMTLRESLVTETTVAGCVPNRTSVFWTVRIEKPVNGDYIWPEAYGRRNTCN